MSDYEDEHYDDESFEEASPVKSVGRPRSPPQDADSVDASPPPPPPPPPPAPQLHDDDDVDVDVDDLRSKSSVHSSKKSLSSSASSVRGNEEQRVKTPEAAAPQPMNTSSTMNSVEPTPREHLNWLKPTPKTPPQVTSQPPTSRRSPSPPASNSPHQSSRRSSVSRRSSASSPPRSRQSSIASSNSSRYSSPFSSPEKVPSVVPPIAAAVAKPTSAPAIASQRSRNSSRDSGHRSNPEPRSPPPKHSTTTGAKRQGGNNNTRGAPTSAASAAPTTNGFPRVAQPASVQEINLLRLKNAELERAIDEARAQLCKLAPRMSVFKVKRRTDDERLKKLQADAQVLSQEFEHMSKRAREANHVRTLEKHIQMREEEIKKLTERNRYLQVEIRNNGKRLKHNVNIEEQRKNLLEGLRNERIIAQVNLEKAKKEAESAAHARETLSQRVSELESKDKLRDMPMDEVKKIIELRAVLVQRDEAIANMQHRLAVLKRASDSSALAKHMSGIPAQHHQPPNDLTAVETLKEEIAAMRSKLELHASQTTDASVVTSVRRRQQQQAATAAERQQQGRSPTKKGGALPPLAGGSGETDGWAHRPQATSTKPAAKQLGGDVGKKGGAAAGRRSNSAEGSSGTKPVGGAAAKKGNKKEVQPPRAESVPPTATGSPPVDDGSEDYDDDFASAPEPADEPSVQEEPSNPVAKKQSKAAMAIAQAEAVASVPPTPPAAAEAEDDTPPWMMAELDPPASSQQPQQQQEAARRVATPPRDGQPSWLSGDAGGAQHDAALPQEPVAARTTSVVSTSPSSEPRGSFVAEPTAARASPSPATIEPPPAPEPEPPKKSDEPSWLFDD